jgi:REP element-mobilizing transposase RayT
MYSERKLQRHSNHDYNQSGCYFITMNTKNFIPYFGTINNETMELNDLGRIIAQQWTWLAQQYSYITLDEFIIMPDHLHGIIFINGHADAITPHLRRNHMLLSKAICAFKTTTSKLIHLRGVPEFIWHRSFHDRLITDDQALQNVRNYIQQNPRAWD